MFCLGVGLRRGREKVAERAGLMSTTSSMDLNIQMCPRAGESSCLISFPVHPSLSYLYSHYKYIQNECRHKAHTRRPCQTAKPNQASLLLAHPVPPNQVGFPMIPCHAPLAKTQPATHRLGPSASNSEEQEQTSEKTADAAVWARFINDALSRGQGRL